MKPDFGQFRPFCKGYLEERSRKHTESIEQRSVVGFYDFKPLAKRASAASQAAVDRPKRMILSVKEAHFSFMKKAP